MVYFLPNGKETWKHYNHLHYNILSFQLRCLPRLSYSICKFNILRQGKNANSLRQPCGLTPPSEREAKDASQYPKGPLPEGAVGEADWGSSPVIPLNPEKKLDEHARLRYDSAIISFKLEMFTHE